MSCRPEQMDAADRKKRALEQLHATYGAPPGKSAKTDTSAADAPSALPSHVRNGCLKSELKAVGAPREMLGTWLAKTIPGADPEIIVASKLKDKVLALDNPQKSQFSIRAAERKLRKQRGMHKAMFGKRQMRQLRADRQDKEEADSQYETFAPLQQSWERYVRESLGVHCKGGVLQCAAQATKVALHRIDLVGAHVEVTKARTPGLLGLAGIVVSESKHTLKVVTEDNVFKVVPKAAIEFQMHVLGFPVKVQGSKLVMNPEERVFCHFKLS